MALVLGVAVATTTASFATSSHPETFYACLKKGTLSKVSTSKHSCPSDYSAVEWSQVGPQGAQGPVGSKGATGATGLQGPQGPTGERGPTGAQGPAGTPGGSAYAGNAGELQLPAGLWLVTAHVAGDNPCSLITSAADIDDTFGSYVDNPTAIIDGTSSFTVSVNCGSERSILSAVPLVGCQGTDGDSCWTG